MDFKQVCMTLIYSGTLTYNKNLIIFLQLQILFQLVLGSRSYTTISSKLNLVGNTNNPTNSQNKIKTFLLKHCVLCICEALIQSDCTCVEKIIKILNLYAFTYFSDEIIYRIHLLVQFFLHQNFIVRLNLFARTI